MNKSFAVALTAASLLSTTMLVAPAASAQSSSGSSFGSSFESSRGSSETAAPAAQEELFSEDFDEVPNPAKFTHNLPEGWSGTTRGVTSGEARWNGWTLSTIRDWTWASGTEERHWFTRGHDNVAIIDSKQQRLNGQDSMTASMSTPAVNVAGRDSVDLDFDSHYRQGSSDQYAEVKVYFDGDEGKQILKLDHVSYAARENARIDIPAGAQSMNVEFTYSNGNDDWFWVIDNISIHTPLAPAKGTPTVIDVISDIQGDITDYEKAVSFLNDRPDPAQALVINGDAVDQGTEELWEEFSTATDRTSHASGKTILTAGNHEMYGKESSDTHLQRFYAHAGQDSPITENVVAGVPIITMNSEYYSDVDRDGKEPFVRLSPASLDYLDQRLAHWEREGVTPLLFTHYLLPNTVSMSHSAWYQNDFEDLEALSNVLNKYNNLVAFTSHSHSSLLKQKNWWGMRRYDGTGEAGKRGFPVVNTGAILNEYMPEGDNDEKILPGEASSGLRVKVFGDRVRVEAYDFITGTIVQSHDFPRA